MMVTLTKNGSEIMMQPRSVSNVGIAIIGMACRFPDANSPVELWENVLAKRRSFRRLPPERISLDDYWSPEMAAADRFYSTEAALLKDYEFDRVAFQIPGTTFRATDLTHWLALDVAAEALADAGFPEGHGLPSASVGTYIGNTLTGEFSRTHTLRLRWPYVRRVATSVFREVLGDEKGSQVLDQLLEAFEGSFKAPFPPIDGDSLAGALSNTIAGRICNYFDFGGGGYTVDGACAASLLSVITACNALMLGDVDVAIAGGVDLSIDPFELVGFAKAGALARNEMRIYDQNSEGFWPGEGCGMVVLMRADRANELGATYDVTMQGWGISSDGAGGITRPELEGQRRALDRAYQRAGFGIETVSFFEGHGTGTSIGDATELSALMEARRERLAGQAAIGSVKANIGHTKAAAGVAGLIKATMALRKAVIPPTTGCIDPHPLLTQEDASLRVVDVAECWSSERRRAGVSAMGFGGINSHVVLECVGDRTERLDVQTELIARSEQDVELFVFDADSVEQLSRKIANVAREATWISRGELADLAAELSRQGRAGPARAAVVARSLSELIDRLHHAGRLVRQRQGRLLDVGKGVFVGEASGNQIKMGYLFSGQGARTESSRWLLLRRFPIADEWIAKIGLQQEVTDSIETEVAQPRIVGISVAVLKVLEALGIEATVGVGHSLGELTALSWAGVLGEQDLMQTATARGQAMAGIDGPRGGMASIRASEQDVRRLIEGTEAVIACLNAPSQVVVAGTEEAIEAVMARARGAGFVARHVAVSHAFHSPLVGAAVPKLAEVLSGARIESPKRKVISTVWARALREADDISQLLCEQITSPVRFAEAIEIASKYVDVWVEVGPDRLLTQMVEEIVTTPAIAIDACGQSLLRLLSVLGIAFVGGAIDDVRPLFDKRFVRSITLSGRPRFLENPCERAPASGARQNDRRATSHISSKPIAATPTEPTIGRTVESEDEIGGLVRELVAMRAELPPNSLMPTMRLSSDLHLNSVAVSQLVAEAAQRIDIHAPLDVGEYANASVAQVCDALIDLWKRGPDDCVNVWPAGIRQWVRFFTVKLVDQPLRKRATRKSDDPEARVLAPEGYKLTRDLEHELQLRRRSAVVVYLPSGEQRHLHLLLDAVKAVLLKKPDVFAVVQHEAGGGGFARSVHLEVPELDTCVVNVPRGHRLSAQWVADEIESVKGFVEASYDVAGNRQEPVLLLLPAHEDRDVFSLGPDDVVLVTGGGKGIGTECALAVARHAGARVALLGRSDPRDDQELAENLSRFAAEGHEFRYERCDVGEQASVRRAIEQVRRSFGDPTVIIHAAGVNVPQGLASLDEARIRETLCPKVAGLQNLLSVLDAAALRRVVGFGSLIARTGLRGEAHYALANELLARELRKFHEQHPGCRCLVIDWSVWSGVGMGERLGSLDSLLRQGISPLSVEQGTDLLIRALTNLSEREVIACGRFGDSPTLKLETPELPMLRFVEWPRVFVPQVELVVDVEISTGTDPYLDDHVFEGDRLFPAVMGLEAMTQVVMALTGWEQVPILEAVKFARPIRLMNDDRLTLRFAALVDDDGSVEVVVLSQETGFKVAHFQARARPRTDVGARETDDAAAVGYPNALRRGKAQLEAASDLYGDLFFQRGRFRRVKRYQRLTSSGCQAELDCSENGTSWFARHLPKEFCRGDPAAKDGSIHALQACLPEARVLPTEVAQIETLRKDVQPTIVVGNERSHDEDSFTYDVELLGNDGQLCERWIGLRLQIVERVERVSWSIEPLLAPYVERRLRELMPEACIAVTVEKGGSRAVRRDEGLRRLIGDGLGIAHRPDGKPLSPNGESVSIAHLDEVTLVAVGEGRIGCDLEWADTLAEANWDAVLGADGVQLAELVAEERREELRIAATRVWSMAEALRKSGRLASVPMMKLHSSTDDGWVMFSDGEATVGTFGAVGSNGRRLVLAVLGGN